MNVPDALNHPLRRQILSMLIESGEAKRAAEIVAGGVPEANVSVVAYHARVLEGAGMVSYGEVGPDAAEPTYRFAPSAAEDPEVISLLESTRDNDVADG